MKLLLVSLFSCLTVLATNAEDVSYLRRLRKLTSPAMIWTSKDLDFTILEDEDVTDIENILQSLETAIEHRQKETGESPYLVIYSLDDRTTTESFVEGRDFLDEMPEFMKKGSTHMYPHVLSRKKKPDTSQWAAILDTLETDVQDASDAKLIVLSDSEASGTMKNGVKYLDHALSEKQIDKIINSMASAKVLVIEATIESYPEGGWINHIDRLVSSTKKDVILIMAVTSPLPEGAIHGLLPPSTNVTETGKTEEETQETTPMIPSSVMTDGLEQEGTWNDIYTTEDDEANGDMAAESSASVSAERRRLAPARKGEEDPVVLRIKPAQLSMIIFWLAFGIAIFIAVSCMANISPPNSYLDKAPQINKEF